MSGGANAAPSVAASAQSPLLTTHTSIADDSSGDSSGGSSDPANPDPSPAQPSPAPSVPATPVVSAHPGPTPLIYQPGHLTPNQFTGPGVAKADGEVACGPAAAVAFARAMGKNPSLKHAIDVARTVGWSQSQGMGSGADGEVALLEKLGVPARLEKGAIDWNKVKQVVQSGKPVIINTQNHYWVAEQYNPASGQFNFGNSGSAPTGSHGRTWFKPDELPGISGPFAGAIYLGA
jgi:hypothetical protein